MESLEEISKRIDHLKYDEISPLREEVNDIKIKLNTNDLLTRQSLESNEKLSKAIDVLKSTMIEISQSVKDSNRINGEITKTIEELTKKITSVEINTNESLEKFGNKIDEIDNKSKFDILIWLKNNWFGVVGIFGILYTILEKII